MDLLVKLYDVEPDHALRQALGAEGINVRRALAPELDTVRLWVTYRFNGRWASEAQVAMTRDPASCLIAVRQGRMLGFACYDAVALGMFGPIGVDASMRAKGIGRALLLETLLAMRARGYAYAVVGGAGPQDFYIRTVGAVPVEGSERSVYGDLLKAQD